MKWIKLVVESRSWIGICAMGTYWFTCFSISDLNLNLLLGVFIWTATSGLYSILSLIKDSSNKTLLRSAILFSTISAVLGIYLKVYEFATLLIPLIFIGVLYGYTPFSKFRGLRTVPFLKIFLVASVWILSTMVFPIIYSGVSLSLMKTLLLVSQWIFLMAVTIPFDMRDLELDSPDMKTIPQVIGFTAAKWTSVILVVFHLILCLVFGAFEENSNMYFILTLVFSSVSLFVLFKNSDQRPKLYYTGIIDGLLFLQGVLMLAFM